MNKLLAGICITFMWCELAAMNSKRPTVPKAKNAGLSSTSSKANATKPKDTSQAEEQDTSKYGEFLATKATTFKTFVDQMTSKPDAKEQVNKRDDKGITFLHKAVAGNHELVVHKLLSAGAEPNAIVLRTGPKGKAPKELKRSTALHLAAYMGQRGIVELLLSYGADIDSPGHRSRTPLHLAAQRRNSKLVRLFLDRGAIATSLSDGLTPLGAVLATEPSQEPWEALFVNEKLSIIARMLIAHNPEQASRDGIFHPRSFSADSYKYLLRSLCNYDQDKWGEFYTMNLLKKRYGNANEESIAPDATEVKISDWALGFLLKMREYKDEWEKAQRELAWASRVL